jgi:integrase
MQTNEIQMIGRHWPEQIIVDHWPFWRAWMKTKTIGEDRRRVNELVGRQWAEFANGKQLGPQLMVDWMQLVRSRTGIKGRMLCEARVNIWRMITAAYLRWIHLMGAIEKDPSVCLPKCRKTPPTQKAVFTHEEYLRMVKYGEDNGYTTELWLLTLGYHSGMSIVDCCTLRWTEVQLEDNGPCYIRRIRTKLSPRYGIRAMCTIPIIVGNELWCWFKRFQKIRTEQLAFEREEHLQYVSQAAVDLMETSGMEATWTMSTFIRRALGQDHKGRTFKHLRNTFCSRLINSGTDSILAAKMTGHADPKQLADYVVPEQEAMQGAVLRAWRHVENKPLLAPSAIQNGGNG